MTKLTYKITTVLSLFSLFIFTASPILAAPPQNASSNLSGSPTQEQDAAFFASSGLSGEVSISEIISQIIKVLLSFLGLIFVVLIIYAGFLWMMSRGNEEQITKAKKIMTTAVIGLAIVLAAYLITYFIIDQLLEATKGGTGLD